MTNFLQRIGIFQEQPLRASLAIAAVGFVLMWLVIPPTARESHAPWGLYETREACRTAGHLVFGVTALLCAFNALRRETKGPYEFDAIVVWSVVLCVWIVLLLSGLLNWWQHLRPDLRPPWLENLM